MLCLGIIGTYSCVLLLLLFAWLCVCARKLFGFGLMYWNDAAKRLVCVFVVFFIFKLCRPYDPKDRVNPEAQLDPRTGKSLAYGKKQKAK